MSDSALSRSRSRNSPNLNVSNMMFSRAGGSTAKRMLRDIEQLSQLNEIDPNSVLPPEEECYVLAMWSSDSYYKTVLVGHGGIPAIVQVMRCFQSHQGIQECCCIILGNLCSGGRATVLPVECSRGVVAQITMAMKIHSQSVAVQSAACEALNNMSDLLLSHASNQMDDMVSNVIERLYYAKGMCLPPTHRQIAETILQTLTTTPYSP